jgi:hypothetical protein
MPIAPVQIDFPVNGIDRSMPKRAQPRLTCLDASNVRGWSPLSLNLGGGERDGTGKVFRNAAGALVDGGPGMPINGGVIADRSPENITVIQGNWLNITETWPTSEYNRTQNNAGFYTGTDFLGKWLLIAKNPTQEYGKGNPATGGWPNAPFVTATSTDPRSPNTELRVTSSPVSATDEYGLVWAKPTDNKAELEVMILATPFGRRGDAVAAMQGGCGYIGPCCRMSPSFGSFAVAYLLPVGNDQVALRLDIVTGAAVTSFTSPVTKQLSGNPGPSEFTITIDASSGGSVRAKVAWPAEGGYTDELVADANIMAAYTWRFPIGSVTGVISAGQIVTGPGPGNATGRVVSRVTGGGVDELYVLSLTGAFANGDALTFTGGATATIGAIPDRLENNQSGIFFRWKGTAVYRSIKSIKLRSLEPLPAEVVFSLSSANIDQNAGLWQVPVGVDAIAVYPDIAGVGIVGWPGAVTGYSFGSSLAADAKPAFPVLERIGVPSVAGGVNEPSLLGATAGLAASLYGKRIDYTQMFLPARWKEFTAAATWTTATAYVVGNRVVMPAGDDYEANVYQCLVDHTSDANTRPGSGSTSRGFWLELISHLDVVADFRDTDGSVDDSVSMVFCPQGFAGTFPEA